MVYSFEFDKTITTKKGTEINKYIMKPRNRKGHFSYEYGVRQLLKQLEIGEGKEIRIALKTDVGWRSSKQGWIGKIEDIEQRIYDPATYFVEPVKTRLNIYKVEILVRDIVD